MKTMFCVTLFTIFGPSVFAEVVFGPVVNPVNGHTYYLLGEDTWENAQKDAERMGGHLATIRNQGEQDWVFNTFGSVGGTNRSLWIGLREVETEGNYQWVSGEPVTYLGWGLGEPNNFGSGESFVQMVKAGITNGSALPGSWNDIASPTLPAWPHYDPVHGVVEVDFCSPHKARATAQLDNGMVVAATVVGSGCGYTNPPLVLILGGGGSGATASAEITDGRVTRILISNPGVGYDAPPRILIASPPFVPKLNIKVSRVKVTQEIVLGRRYVLESSKNGTNWTEALAPFTAMDESITNEFDSEETGRFFRVREVH